MTKSMIRHILTAIGTLVALVGLESVTGLLNYLIENLDGLWAAGATIVGAVTTIWGFLRRKEFVEE